jgi:hypothetical protein
MASTVLALSASAAPTTLVLTDPAGDANAGHDQGTETFGTGTAGPGSQAGKDLVSVTFTPTGVTTTTVKGKKKATTFTCTGYTALIELSGPPTANTLYRLLGSTAKNTSLFWLQYDNNPVDGTTSRLGYSAGTAASVDLATPAKVDGSKILLTVTEKDIKAAGESLKALKVQAPGGDVRSSTGAATVPSWDVIPTDDAKSFSPCA